MDFLEIVHHLSDSDVSFSDACGFQGLLERYFVNKNENAKKKKNLRPKTFPSVGDRFPHS